MTATSTNGPCEGRLSPSERRLLLDLARRSVVATVHDEALPEVDGLELPPMLAAPGAAFVTLHQLGQLRGCIGTVEPRHLSLVETVILMARAAASEDPRFPRVRPDEVASLEIEISVMGPLVPVSSPSEIEIGRDGLVVEEGFHRGLLLPQVPVEWGWDRDTFLRQTCLKAGLPPDAWPGRARLFRFSAEVFGEQPHAAPDVPGQAS